MTFRQNLVYATFLFALTCCSPATAGDLWSHLRCLDLCIPDCIGQYRCDDYRAKCPPCARPALCFQADDYCGKCGPRTKCLTCFTCDDYCRKPFDFCCPRDP